ENFLVVRACRASRPVRGALGYHPAGTVGTGRRDEGRYSVEVLDSGWFFDAVADRRPSGCATRLRGGFGSGHTARHDRTDDFQRDGSGAVGGHEMDPVLRARVLREVHTVPRGHLLDVAG